MLFIMTLPPTIRRCLSKILNKQFLVFLFFLALSTTFWIFQTMEETYEEDFYVPIQLTNVPKNVVITTDLPSNFHISVRDKGRILLGYKYTRNFRPVNVDFNTYATPSGHAIIRSSELRKQIATQLQQGSQLLSVKPDTVDFYFNYGQCKRVPVVIQDQVKPERMFSISHRKLSQDSVTVYASSNILDTLTAAYTQPIQRENVSDTTQISQPFVKVDGVKYEPARVNVTYCVDRLVEKTINIPVQQVNFPASKQLRTFPATVNVTFQVSMGMYRQITRDNFIIVINYEDLLKNKSNQCRLTLKTIPQGVSHVRILPESVEYIIEEIPEEEDSEI